MAKAKQAVDGHGRPYIHFWCPGCEERHVVHVGPRNVGPAWGFNGDLERPTLTPSILVTSGCKVPGWTPDRGCWCQPDPDGEKWDFSCGVCHSFVKDGQIQFLSDCTHALAGRTVELPEIPADG